MYRHSTHKKEAAVCASAHHTVFHLSVQTPLSFRLPLLLPLQLVFYCGCCCYKFIFLSFVRSVFLFVVSPISIYIVRFYRIHTVRMLLLLLFLSFHSRPPLSLCLSFGYTICSRFIIVPFLIAFIIRLMRSLFCSCIFCTSV